MDKKWKRETIMGPGQNDYGRATPQEPREGEWRCNDCGEPWDDSHALHGERELTPQEAEGGRNCRILVSNVWEPVCTCTDHSHRGKVFPDRCAYCGGLFQILTQPTESRERYDQIKDVLSYAHEYPHTVALAEAIGAILKEAEDGE